MNYLVVGPEEMAPHLLARLTAMHVTISVVLHPGLVLGHQRSRIIRDVRLRGALPPPMDQDTDDRSPDVVEVLSMIDV